MTNAYESYLESTILSADPLELIVMLYRAGQEAVGRARAALQRGDIAQRSREITKAGEILTELSFALDHRQGGEISRNLAELYDYMQRRLIDANVNQKPEPLVEVEGLLATLKEGWDSCRASLQPQAPAPRAAYDEHFHPDSVPEYCPVSLTA